MPITFQALFAPSSLAIKFAIKTVLGGGLALWLAMRWGLEQPSWALMTAFIVAQPLSGMVVQKGLARLAGTLVGTIMSVVFMALFAQTPWLFLITLALWLALCTAASTQLRSAWAYAFVLAGYTVAIIALPAVNHPLQVFDQAVARCTEICLGICCATATSALLWPMRVEQQLSGQARQAWQTGLQAAAAMLGGEDEARKGLLEILGRIVAIDSQREHAWFEGNRGRQRASAIRGLSQKLMVLLRISRSVRRQWRQLDEQEAGHIAPWLEEVRALLIQPDKPSLLVLRQRIWDAAHDEHISSAEHYCLARMTLLIDVAMAATQAVEDVEAGRAPKDAAPGLAVHRDLPLALLFGARSALAFLVMSSFWLATAWPSAPGGLVLTCVVCSLFASRENGAQIGLSFLRGILLAFPVAFLVGEILLPQWSSFAMLCLGMGVPLFFGALCMANPRTAGTATSYCLHFIVLVSPLNTMKFDVANMLNSAQAMLIGVGAAVLAFRLVVLRHPAWLGRRLRAATQSDLVRLTRRDLRGADSWFGGRMADRLMKLAHHASELPEAERKRWDDGLHGLDIGDELVHLRMCLAVANVPIGSFEREYLQQVEHVLANGPAAGRGEQLDAASERFIEVLRRQPPSDPLRLAEGAVLQLQKSWRKWCRWQEEAHGFA
ncbi:FUSC family protein [Pseudomonas sp. SWI6]|uniref:FUSC family protein n=1 Tax=Pseudomonas taiwanensis TaxID=470150 RepID=A0ABR6VC70_9PSED|nr:MULTISPECIES: FUSC family protein [Pseudomonas]AVD84482.1 FUSC family protein [Pseudomonas sp. SWI6]AVD86711.1 FUSC family protein [Pseudomonas sp. SWI44]MBC3478121.1 FUSC family protein [Pseudomonas taiwanensis]MBC3493278.1 FUSC family protein [Pseudomonas taiwanensis]MDT8925547.1 FUSC family protein [Pseudomonas taiwanensis]